MANWEKAIQLEGPLLDELKSLYSPQFPFELRHHLASWIETQAWTEVIADNPNHEREARTLCVGMLEALQELIVTSASDTSQRTQFEELYTNMTTQHIQHPLEFVRIVQHCLSKEAELMNRQSRQPSLMMEESLITACDNGDHPLVRSLIKSEADVNCLVTVGFTQWSPLERATHYGYTNIVKLLLEHGADINLQDNDGETALMVASVRAHVNIAKMLLERGAQVDLQNKNGWCALMWPCREGHVESARVLLEYGATVDLRNKSGNSSLIVACKWGKVRTPQTTKLLLENGAQVNLQNSEGESALMWASINRQVDTVKLLLEHGAQANLKMKNGEMPLSLARSDQVIDLLMMATLPQLVEILLPIASKWRDLGKRLGLSRSVLDSIQASCGEKYEICVERVFLTWSKVHYPCPTWRALIRAVKSVDVSIAQTMDKLVGPTMRSHITDSRIESDSGEDCETDSVKTTNKQKSPTEANKSEASHLAAVAQAMKAKGTLEHTLVHGVLVGPAGTGKSSLMSRLFGEMPNSKSPSTGVANSVVQVKVRRSSSISGNIDFNSSSPWMKLLYDEEAARLMNFASCVVSSHTKRELHASLTKGPHPLSTLATSTIHVDAECSPVQVSDSNFSSKQSGDSAVPCSMDNGPIAVPDGYVSPLNIFKNAFQQTQLEDLRQQFENSWSLYLTDTGGQIEFQEVLPLLVSGPSIFFITFRLDQDINQRIMIEYRLADSQCSKPYQSTLTVVEVILQTLASVASMGTFTYRCPQMKSAPIKPKVFIVGTHKDQLDESTSQSTIKEIDNYLQQVIKSTSHYRNDLVEFANESQLIFAVNNFSEEDSDFQEIRLGVEKAIQRGQYKMSFPSHWLIFGLVLRQESIADRIVTYDECFAIARDCGITNQEELNDALQFLHTKIGLIRHFRTPGLNDIVIRDPQVMFDHVTQLIVETFTFDNLGKRRCEEFKKRGIFCFEDLVRITRCRPQSHLTPEKLIELLKHLQIVAPFQTEEGRTVYFFPCILAHSETCKPKSLLKSSNVPPLLITFKCGYCPKGLPGALVVYLLTHEPRSKFTWKLKPEQIFKDQVSFLVSRCDIIALSSHPTYLELTHSNSSLSSSKCSSTIESICHSVRRFVKKGLRKVMSNLKLISDAQYSCSFYCQDSDCVTSNGCHPADEFKKDEDRPYLWCVKSNEIVTSDPPTGWSTWYGKLREIGTEMNDDVGGGNCHSVTSAAMTGSKRDCALIDLDLDFDLSESDTKKHRHSSTDMCLLRLSSTSSSKSSCSVVGSQDQGIFTGTMTSSQCITSPLECDAELTSSYMYNRMSSTNCSESNFSLCSFEGQKIDVPNLTTLSLLKWRDDQGHQQELRLIQTVSPAWRKLGPLIGMTGSQLQTLSKKYHDDAEECCMDVFIHWLENPPPNYLATWEGLCSLLNDLQYSYIAKVLRKVLLDIL